MSLSIIINVLKRSDCLRLDLELKWQLVQEERMLGYSVTFCLSLLCRLSLPGNLEGRLSGQAPSVRPDFCHLFLCLLFFFF